MTSPDQRWCVYIVRCGDGTLYTGIATDVPRRLTEHREDASRAAKYLRGRGPLELVLSEPIGERGLALRVERRIKRLPRSGKEGLIDDSARLLELVADEKRRQSL